MFKEKKKKKKEDLNRSEKQIFVKTILKDVKTKHIKCTTPKALSLESRL